jgi:ketosteroid isomerase-like protein
MTGNAQRAQDLYAAFARGDVPAVLAMFDPQIRWSPAEGHPYQPSGAPWVGPAAVLEHLFKRIAADWEDFVVHVQRMHDAGDCIVAEGRYTGVYKPTGKRIDVQMCHILQFADGRLCRFQQYMDTGQVQAAMTTLRG